MKLGRGGERELVKPIVKFGLIGVALMAFLVGAAAFFLDSIIKAAVEKVGPQVTGTSVTLDAVRVLPFSGRGRIQGLVVGNPEGFKTENAIRLADAQVRLDVASLFSNRVVINELVFDRPEITYERGRSGSNIDKIAENAEAYGTPASSDQKAEKVSKAEEGATKTFQIHRLVVKNGRVRLSAALMKGKTVEIALPDLEIRDIGKGSNGATLQEVASRIFAAIQADIGRAVASSKTLEPELGKAQEKAKEIGGAAEKAIKGVRGLFGK